MGNSQGLYLGKELKPDTRELGARLELDPADLLTHGLIVGMTGSGKTGLAIALIEELLRQGVPVLAIDPKGDLGNLLLLFEDLKAASFEPWIDPEAARRDGKDVKEAAAEAAASWTKGLAEWGLGASDIASLKRSHDAAIYTPGSRAGISLNVLQSLEAPSAPFAGASEDLRDEIAGIVAGLLGLLRIDADPLQSRESIFLSNLIESSWKAGRSLSLETLVASVSDPPFDKLGALPLETVFPRKDRQGLMMALNNLLAAPSFEVWREGEPLDIGAMLRTKDGRPRLSIVSTAHLSEDERLFVTALLLDKVKTWMRGQTGTSELRAFVYMDEIFGYFPPHPANPPTKRPLLTLLKQARAQGVGVMLATQNPVDLDYKGLANMGTWMVGTLQTDQDRARLREGLTATGLDAAKLDRLLDATGKRVFLLHDVHRPAPCLLHSRWAMSYLRGPITRDEISRLMAGRAKPGATKPATVPSGEGPPVLPPPFKHNYLAKYGAELADPFLLVKYAVRYKGMAELIAVRGYPLGVGAAAEILEAEPVEIDETAVTTTAPPGVRYSDLPGYLAEAGARGIEKVLKDRLADKLALTTYVDPITKAESQPREDRASFAARLLGTAGGAVAAKLKDQLDKKERDLAAREADLSGRKTEKWTALGTAVLQNIGLFTGRKRTISGAGAVLTKNRMENNAEARVEALRAEVADLRQRLAETETIDPARFEEQTLVPARTAVKILRYDLVWIS
jgi:DNA helicase HerA-like ATPase